MIEYESYVNKYLIYLFAAFGVSEVKAVGNHFKNTLKKAKPSFETEDALLELRLLKVLLHKK